MTDLWHLLSVTVSVMERTVILAATAMLGIAAATITNFADVPCGRSKALPRIVGGQNASQGEFPWLVSVRKGSAHQCGGTLVNSRWVLTAAHCLCNGGKLVSTRSVRVTVGAHDLRTAGPPSLPVARFVIHPDYSCSTHHHDLALLLLDVPLDWTTAVRPACFPGPSTPSYANLEAEVAGWGWTDENYAKGFQSDVLQKVQLSVVANPKCQEWFKSQGKRLKVLDSQICAGTETGGKDACQAYSGGPLMVDDEGKSVVVGVVSAGIGCARPRLPGLYTRVSHFLNWITESISNDYSMNNV